MTTTIVDQQMLEEKISKLPKWAQDHIEKLERQLTNAQNQVDILKRERSVDDMMVFDDEPIVTWENLMDGEHKIPALAYVKIYFPKKGNSRFRKYIAFHWRKDDEVLDVTSSDVIVVKPRATNTIRIDVENR